MISFSEARSTSVTKSLRPFSSTLIFSMRSVARRIFSPALRAARRAILTIGSMTVSKSVLRGGDCNRERWVDVIDGEPAPGPGPVLWRRLADKIPAPRSTSARRTSGSAMNTAILAKIRIVLVDTNHPGNIGGAARALKNMGLSQLWLVSPREYPSERALWRAASALDVLDNAVVVDTLDEAVADCGLVVGTSAR